MLDKPLNTWIHGSATPKEGDSKPAAHTTKIGRARALGANTSSLPCVASIKNAVRLTTVAIEEQHSERAASPPWGMFGENLQNFRMNSAAMASGISLMERHAVTSGLSYDALVRIRADLGLTEAHGSHAAYLSEKGWSNVARRAESFVNGTQGREMASEVVTCGWPKTKRTDFCIWSSPPSALQRTINSLRGSGFDQVVYEQNCSQLLNRSLQRDFQVRQTREVRHRSCGL